MATPAILLLENEAPFVGVSRGAEGVAHGVMAVNALYAGHADLLTDPSYAGKIVCFAYPHVGNSGVVPDELQSDGVHATAVVAREFCKFAANRLGVETIGEFLERNNIPAIEGVDTRSVVEIVMRRGTVRAVVGSGKYADAALLAREFDLYADDWAAPKTGTAEAYDFKSGGKRNVVVVDLGVKKGFLRRLVGMGCGVKVLPAAATAGQILAGKPDGVVFSAGAGAPAERSEAAAAARELIGRVPLWGVGVGAGLLAEAMGATIVVNGRGHVGVFPVGRPGQPSSELTAQCRGFWIEAESLAAADLTLTHFNLDDGSVEGFGCDRRKVMGVLFHPEAEPGSRDCLYLFDRFYELMRK